MNVQLQQVNNSKHVNETKVVQVLQGATFSQILIH